MQEKQIGDIQHIRKIYEKDTLIDPITSYGIILFRIDDKKIEYLLCQRRDTIEYAVFIRGQYSKQQLPLFIQLMTQDERCRLFLYTFDDLWNDLWTDHDNIFFRIFYEKAKCKFLNNIEYVKELINSFPSNIKEPSWGFPKGRKNTNEKEITCALREFEEETTLSITYKTLSPIEPSIETFIGSNKKIYRTYYYIAHYTKKKINIKKKKLDYIRKETLTDETSNIGWFDLSCCQEKLIEWRYKMLQETDEKIRKKYNL